MNLADKLRYARKKVGLTGAQVRERTGLGESSLSEFENGKRDPKVSQLRALAEAYQRSVSFFLSEDEPVEETVRWRSPGGVKPEETEATFLRLCRQYRNLEIWCGEKSSSRLPALDRPSDSLGYEQTKSMAIGTRRSMGLGDRPALELLSCLEEDCGVKVFHLEFEPTGTAASVMTDSFGPAVLLNSKNKRWRRNFDLAHELFHLLTWRRAWDSEQGSQDEKWATCFARNLLMPEESIRQAVDGRMDEGGAISVEGVVDIARKFDVSTSALLWHMHFLYGRGPEEQSATERDIERARRAASLMEEREDTVPPKWPGRYKSMAMRALRRGEISSGRLAEYLDITRRKAMSYAEQEIPPDDKVQIAPA